MNLTAPLLLTCVLAIPPLSPDQRGQVETATDGEVFDEPALYPLLKDALTWEAGDEAGAMIPDYESLLNNAEERARLRGGLFLIEGRFIGVPHSRKQDGTGLTVQRLSRPGPWEGKLQQWGVKVDKANDKGEAILVYLLDPPNEPLAGQRVRLVARFYKVWKSKRYLTAEEELKGMKLEDAPVESFLVFVGKTATVSAGSGKSLDGIDKKFLWVVGGAVLIMIVGWWRIRKNLTPRMTHAQQRLMERREAREAGVTADNDMVDDGEPLPEDPIEAMEEMERRRRAAAEAEDTTPELEALKAVQREGKPLS